MRVLSARSTRSLVAATIAIASGMLGCGQKHDIAFDDPRVFPQLESTLEGELADNDLAHSDIAFKKSPLFQRMLADASSRDLLAMARNREHALLSLAACRAIRAKHPAQYALAATYVLMHSKWIEKGVFGEQEEFLTTYHGKNDLYACLDAVTHDASKCRLINLIILGDTFGNNGVLSKWFDDRASSSFSQPWLSVILGRVVPVIDDGSRSNRMEKMLALCANEEGYPRYVYLFLTNESDEAYLDILASALADQSLSRGEFSTLVHMKKKILTRIDVNRLDMSPDRREIIARELAAP